MKSALMMMLLVLVGVNACWGMSSKELTDITTQQSLLLKEQMAIVKAQGAGEITYKQAGDKFLTLFEEANTCEEEARLIHTRGKDDQSFWVWMATRDFATSIAYFERAMRNDGGTRLMLLETGMVYFNMVNGDIENAKPKDANQEIKPMIRPAQAKEWTLKAVWSGSATKSTEKFTVVNPWKIQWTTTPGPSGEGNFQICIYSEEGLSGIAANVIGANSDESVQHKAGTYYLEFNAGQAYQVKVLELR